jgi:hypothetical protein
MLIVLPLILILLSKLINLIDWSSINKRFQNCFESEEKEEHDDGKTSSNDEISLNEISYI